MRTAESILRGLNPPQRAATRHLEGPLLVLAGAGSGKTRVITHRIGYMLTQGIAPENILAMSFTNKAAGEMRERAAGMVGKETAKRLNLSTFHSMGADLLRRHIKRLGFRTPFTILDQGDQVRVVKDIMEELGLLSKQGVKPDKVHAIISRAKNAFCEPRQLKTMRFNPLVPYAQKVYRQYVEACQALNAVDFDDLITLPVRLLEEHPDLLEQVRDRYRYIMVDEYQDTNDTQLLLLDQLVGPRQNICAVGDDDQSIYAFRGAVAQNILEFDRRFPGARVVKLEQNYRSTSTILQAANSVIANNRTRRKKILWSALGDGEKIKYFELESDGEEADFTAGDIHRRWRDGRDIKWSDFAILMRTSVLARHFEEALRAMDIPYKLIGGGSYFDRREVKDIVAYMQSIINPSNEVALRRIINTPRRGIGPGAMSAISQFASNKNIPLHVALRRAEQIEGLGPRQKRKLGRLVKILDGYNEKFEGMPLHEALKELLDELAFEEHLLQSEKSEKVARIRIQNVKELLNSMRTFQERTGGRGLATYLQRLTLDGKSNSKQEDEEGEKLTMMTLHASKGLEFPHVYLVGFEEDILPHSRSLEVGGDGDLEEERRLTYVGITRAKESLILTSAQKRGKGKAARERKVSRFLHEIPDEAINKQAGNTGYGPSSDAVKMARKANLAKMRAVLFGDG